MNGSFQIREYVESGHSPYREWFEDLDEVTAARANTYIRRLEAGNFGAAKRCRKASLNCAWILGPATACITGAKPEPSSFSSAAAASDAREQTSPPQSPDGSVTGKPEPKMITIRDYSETIIARIKREPKFARALYAEAI